ncbi:MAG: hypothetical protein AAB606_03090, partial [Patescibacteria group bacterium]
DTPMNLIGNNSFVYTYTQPAGLGNANESGAVTVQTIVSFNLAGKFVRYLSKKTDDGSVINQTADIKGGIRMDIFDAKGLAQSHGENMQSTRTLFSKAIKSSLSGQLATLVGEGANGRTIDVNTLSDNKILYYKRDKLLAQNKPCTIVLDIGNLTFDKTNTIVADGCDVFIDSNLMAAAVDFGTVARLGIIALEDLTMPANQRRGGNIYICGKVTDVEANMVMDGSLFSYGAGVNNCGGLNKSALVNAVTGYPNFGGSMKDVLKNQLSIKGSIVGNNTYGGSLLSPPLFGDGTRAVTPDEKAATRLFDLNFLRYAKTVPTIDEDGNTILCWAEDITCSKLVGTRPVCDCLINNATRNSVVTITYQAASQDMPIFNLMWKK